MAVALALVAGAAQAAPRFDARTAAAIDKAAMQQVARGATSGLAIEVVQDGKVVFARGYGMANLEWGQRVTPDTVFRIASNTKAFTAASILVLVQEGKVGLDDRLDKYLPDFPRAHDVTIRQLLTHTSGVRTFDEVYGDGPELAVRRTPAEMIALISHLKPVYEFEPGAAYKYSNSGYHLLGAVIEKVSGQTLNAFMTEHIFKKLGMSHTAMDAIEDVVPMRAAGYMQAPGKPGAFVNSKYVPETVPGPAGGLRSTVGDLGLWYEGLFSGKVVDPALFQQMITPSKVNDGRLSSAAAFAPPGTTAPRPANPYEYGFGIRISNLQGHREYWHSGAVEGFTSNIRTYPDDHLTIVLLANTFRALDGVLEAVEAEVLGLGGEGGRP